MRKPCGDDSGSPTGHRWIFSSPQATQTLVGAAAIVKLSIFRLGMVFLRPCDAADAAGLQRTHEAPMYHRVVRGEIMGRAADEEPTQSTQDCSTAWRW